MSAIQVIKNGMPFMLQGAWVTLWISLTTLMFASFVGLLLAVLAQFLVFLRPVFAVLVNIIRGLPLVVEVFLVYFGLPLFGVRIEPYSAAILALTIFFSSGMYELVRGAIEAIAKGQTEAALALGMTKFQALQRVVLPQAIRLLLSPWVGEFTGIIKGSSLLSLLSIYELTLAGKEIVERTFMGIQVWGFVMLIYFVLCFSLSYLSKRLERRLHYAK